MERLEQQQLLEKALAAQRRGSIADAKRQYALLLEIDPDNAAAYGNLAIIAAQQGDLAEAEQLLRRATSLRPDDALSFNNLGLVLLQQGRTTEAIVAHRRAIELRPAYAEAHFALGNAFKQQGALADAIASYGNAIAIRAGYPEAFNNIGVVLQRQGRRSEAIAAYHKALALRPTYGEASFNLGVVLHESGELAAAEAAYREVIQSGADIPLLHNNLGAVLQDQGRLDEAIVAFDKAIALAPDFAEAHYNRGLALQSQKRLGEALAAYGQAIKLRPDYIDAVNRSGIVLQETGRAPEAVALYRRLLESIGSQADVLNNLAAALMADGRPREALDALHQAFALKPDFPEALYNAGNAWRELGDLEQAIAAYRNAWRLRPDYDDAFGQLVYHRWRACDWEDYEGASRRITDMLERGARVPPFYLLSTPASAADQLACARHWLQPIVPPDRDAFSHREVANGTRIRIGYLSSDFHQHATAHLMAELFEHHDRDRFEVIAYSYGEHDDSAMRARLERTFDCFVDIRHLSHREAAERVRSDRIGILIDLKGYTHHARPQIAAYRPAAIQVSYLGYPATTGASFIDYIIADEFVVPVDQQEFFSEKVVYLPGCYQVNDRKREIALNAASRQECGLPAKGFVFCSFNNAYKITPSFFDIWMRLLKAVPGSVLWLLETHRLVKRNLRLEAERRGVDPDRLVFAPIVSPAAHLARHRNADLFLDTLPCNAHTTASDALWAGLPVLTCAGKTFAGRVAGSLLAAVGLPDLITTSREAYERKALALATDPDLLSELRARLQRNRDMSPLFDLPRMTRNIEAAYARMWSAWCNGQQPISFSIEDQS